MSEEEIRVMEQRIQSVCTVRRHFALPFVERPSKEIPRMSRVCIQCKQQFFFKPSRLKQKGEIKFCTRTCRLIYGRRGRETALKLLGKSQ